MERRTILEDFIGTTCLACGRPKRANFSHCGKCYHALPKAMQSALYLRFGSGYEEAFEASVAWLRDHRPQRSFKY